MKPPPKERRRIDLSKKNIRWYIPNKKPAVVGL